MSPRKLPGETELIGWPWDGPVMVTVSPDAGCPWASVTVAVAVDVETPLAMTELGSAGRASSIEVAGPRVWVSVLESAMGAGETELLVAVIVAVPTAVELVIVAVYVPFAPPAVVAVTS